ncbi:hypothetical protein BDP67DRAFT_119494 [Colletotrichum lupini]|nr:hypothetical protein BDP67DRAFT_119494 [Colletotrichum lupini]
MHPSCRLSFSQLDGGRVRCSTLTNPLDQPFTGQSLDSRQPPPSRPPMSPPVLRLVLVEPMIPVLVLVAGLAPHPRSTLGPGSPELGSPLSPSVSAPPTRPPYRATFLCLLAQIFQTNASLLSVGLSSFYSQNLRTIPILCALMDSTDHFLTVTKKRLESFSAIIQSGTEYSLTTRSPFASNKSSRKAPNFSPPSITLSDVGPDPGLSSTGQDKPTLHLVFCGCRVLMLVGPDPRSPFALFLSLSSLFLLRLSS